MKRETKAVSFKMPLETYERVAAYARARGVDVSSVLNAVVAEALPALVRADARLRAAGRLATKMGAAEAAAAFVEAALSEFGPYAAEAGAREAVAALLSRLPRPEEVVPGPHGSFRPAGRAG